MWREENKIMALKRVILENGDRERSARRQLYQSGDPAVQDAIHHSSLSMIRSLGVDSKTMRVEVTIGVQQPGQSRHRSGREDIAARVATVKAVLGGLDVPDQAGGDVAIIASAAVAVRLDLP